MVNNSAGFKHQSVRDLAWAVRSPPLILQPSYYCVWPEGRWYQQIYQETLPWLEMVDSDPAELDELLASQKDRRLGKYFETLWLFWLSHNPRYQVIENNLQIIIDGETLGEIDLIVFDKITKQTLHWELAVKFYLGLGDTTMLSNWHGPNLRDRLDIKVDHLLHRQSVVTRDQRVVQWLKQQGISVDQCVVILKGRLYYPWKYFEHLFQGAPSAEMISPVLCAPDHLFSLWLTQSKFDEVFDDKQCFSPLINTGWLERMSTSGVKKSYSKSELFETLSNNMMRLPLHVQLLNPRHSWDRAFMTGENWPHKNI